MAEADRRRKVDEENQAQKAARQKRIEEQKKKTQELLNKIGKVELEDDDSTDIPFESGILVSDDNNFFRQRIQTACRRYKMMTISDEDREYITAELIDHFRRTTKYREHVNFYKPEQTANGGSIIRMTQPQVDNHINQYLRGFCEAKQTKPTTKSVTDPNGDKTPKGDSD